MLQIKGSQKILGNEIYRKLYNKVTIDHKTKQIQESQKQDTGIHHSE